MAGVKILGGPRGDEDHTGVVAMLAEPSRVDNFFRIHCLDLSIDPYSFTNRTKSVAAEQARQSRLDSLDHRRAFVDETCVKLDQRRAGADVQPRVFGGSDAADADDRDFAAGVGMDVADQLACANRQRTAAESARMR